MYEKEALVDMEQQAANPRVLGGCLLAPLVYSYLIAEHMGCFVASDGDLSNISRVIFYSLSSSGVCSCLY